MSDSGRQVGDCRHARTPEACVECLRARLRALEAAFVALATTNDFGDGLPCWCKSPVEAEKIGHGKRCTAARAALGAGPGGGT